MNHPLVPLPQAGGSFGSATGIFLVFLAVLFLLAAIIKQKDLPFARLCMIVSLVFFAGGFFGPPLFGDWAAIIPIGCAFGLGVILLKA